MPLSFDYDTITALFRKPHFQEHKVSDVAYRSRVSYDDYLWRYFKTSARKNATNWNLLRSHQNWLKAVRYLNAHYSGNVKTDLEKAVHTAMAKVDVIPYSDLGTRVWKTGSPKGYDGTWVLFRRRLD